MNDRGLVECEVKGFLSSSEPYIIRFELGDDLTIEPVSNNMGPNGISAISADLADIAAVVYQIERHLKGRGRTNPAAKFNLSIQLREPTVWNKTIISLVQDILNLMGYAEWNISVHKRINTMQEVAGYERGKITQVVLFSGGMDSTCGLATLQPYAGQTQAVSFFTRQKSIQMEIAEDLGFAPPLQWHMSWNKKAGRGHHYFYRSFMFLCLAAVTAESWGARTIYQYENGILATAIPPSPAWLMTRHAYPQIHRLSELLFNALFGGDWQICNPFLLMTKREEFVQAQSQVGTLLMLKALSKTETCWFQYSNRIPGGKKRPSIPCGVCIPCIIRRTVALDENYQYDLRLPEVRNNAKLGAAFRSYFGFLNQVRSTRESLANFYRLIDSTGQALLPPEGEMNLTHLHLLFLRFADEFFQVYNL
jgi:7-cyano-7-deazaguanine synthase in queuosine biosynthesis